MSDEWRNLARNGDTSRPPAFQGVQRQHGAADRAGTAVASGDQKFHLYLFFRSKGPTTIGYNYGVSQPMFAQHARPTIHISASAFRPLFVRADTEKWSARGLVKTLLSKLVGRGTK